MQGHRLRPDHRRSEHRLQQARQIKPVDQRLSPGQRYPLASLMLILADGRELVVAVVDDPARALTEGVRARVPLADHIRGLQMRRGKLEVFATLLPPDLRNPDESRN